MPCQKYTEKKNAVSTQNRDIAPPSSVRKEIICRPKRKVKGIALSLVRFTGYNEGGPYGTDPHEPQYLSKGEYTLNDILLIGYEFSVSALPALIAAFVFRAVRKKEGTETRGTYMLTALLFVLYLFAVLHVTGAGTICDAKRYGPGGRAWQINLTPFSDPDTDLIAYGLNVLLFVPFGLLFPLFRPAGKRMLSTVTAGFLFSLAVELSQLLNNRRTDIDDLILNTLGTVAGVVLFAWFFRRKTKADPAVTRLNREPYLRMAVMFFCRFLLYDEFSAAKLLFGF